MTDAGAFPPAPEAAATGERARLLRQIADALNLPPSAFSRAADPAPAEAPSSAECGAMLAAFTRIRDPRLRRHCLTMLERCAEI